MEHLELTVKLKDGTQYHNFIYCDEDEKYTREEIIEQETNMRINRIEKAKSGNPIWANHSERYAEWESFEIV